MTAVSHILMNLSSHAYFYMYTFCPMELLDSTSGPIDLLEFCLSGWAPPRMQRRRYSCYKS